MQFTDMLLTGDEGDRTIAFVATFKLLQEHASRRREYE